MACPDSTWPSSESATDVCCREYGFDDSLIVHGPKLPCVVASGRDVLGLNRLEPPPTTDIFEKPLDARSRLRFLAGDLRSRASDIANRLTGKRAGYQA